MYFELLLYYFLFFFFKQKTAYEMRISDWSSDVCSSDLTARELQHLEHLPRRARDRRGAAVEAGGERRDRVGGIDDPDRQAVMGEGQGERLADEAATRNQDIAAQRFAHRLALDRNGADEKRAAFDLVRAKTRRREEVRSGRQAPSSSPAPPGAEIGRAHV